MRKWIKCRYLGTKMTTFWSFRAKGIFIYKKVNYYRDHQNDSKKLSKGSKGACVNYSLARGELTPLAFFIRVTIRAC